MPLVKRGAEKSENEKPAKKRKKEYELLDNIGYKADLHHSLFRELPDSTEETYKLIARYIVSFLNTTGGILVFGVRPSGVIYGEKISRCEEDHLKCAIDEGVKRIIPYVPSNKYSVSFTPVMGRHFDDKASTIRQVLEIRVNPGDPDELYEDSRHEAFTRNENRLIGPLTPHQIKDITIAKLKKRIQTEQKLAEFLSPAKPSVITKKSATGEGHKELAVRAVSSKERIMIDKEKSSSSQSSLATVVTASTKLNASQLGKETARSESDRVKNDPRRVETAACSSGSSGSGSSGSSKVTRETQTGTRSKRSTSGEVDSMSKRDENKLPVASASKVNQVVDKVGSKHTAAVVTVSKSSTVTNPSHVPKPSTTAASSTVAKSSTISSTVAKPTISSVVVKPPTVPRSSTITKPSTSRNVSQIKTSIVEKCRANAENKTNRSTERKTEVSKPAYTTTTSQKPAAVAVTRKPLSTVNSSRNASTSATSYKPATYSSSNCIRKTTVKLPPPPQPPRFSQPTYPHGHPQDRPIYHTQPSYPHGHPQDRPIYHTQPSYPHGHPQATPIYHTQPSNIHNLPKSHTLQWYWDKFNNCYVRM